MIRIRVVLSLVVVVVLAGGWLAAQDPKTTGKGRSTLPLYWSKLKLSDEQKVKAVAVQKEFRPKIDALKQKVAELEEQERAELAKILTPEQRKELQKIIATKVVGGESPDKDAKKPEEKKP